MDPVILSAQICAARQPSSAQRSTALRPNFCVSGRRKKPPDARPAEAAAFCGESALAEIVATEGCNVTHSVGYLHGRFVEQLRLLDEVQLAAERRGVAGDASDAEDGDDCEFLRCWPSLGEVSCGSGIETGGDILKDLAGRETDEARGCRDPRPRFEKVAFHCSLSMKLWMIGRRENTHHSLC